MARESPAFCLRSRMSREEGEIPSLVYSTTPSKPKRCSPRHHVVGAFYRCCPTKHTPGFLLYYTDRLLWRAGWGRGASCGRFKCLKGTAVIVYWYCFAGLCVKQLLWLACFSQAALGNKTNDGWCSRHDPPWRFRMSLLAGKRGDGIGINASRRQSLITYRLSITAR